MTELTPISCYAHPDRETGLRCKRCERPICASCAQHTPTGYLCKDCVREQQKKFDTAVWSDYLIVFFTSAILSALGAIATIIITSIVWGIFIIFLAPLAGNMIANTARYFVKNRRSPKLNYILAAGMILGALPVLIYSSLPYLPYAFMGGNFMGMIAFFAPMLWQVVYLVLATPAAYSQFSGLVFRR